MADLGQHFGALFYEREARFLMAEEWAETAEDMLERRTKHGLHLQEAEQRAFAAWLAGAGRQRVSA
jgi:glycerol-3-phosphate dehydrogenase